MLNTIPGTAFYFQIPDESEERILYPATVQEWNENSYTAGLNENDPALEAGQEVLIYYEIEHELVKQGARIELVSKMDSTIVFRFELTGDSVSAERRQSYRVSTVMAEVSATFGAEENCPVLDVSATGFAVVASRRYRTATVVDAAVYYAGITSCGKGRIESIRELEPGRIRFGVHCISDKETGGTLQAGLQNIYASVQLQHLLRLKQVVAAVDAAT